MKNINKKMVIAVMGVVAIILGGVMIYIYSKTGLVEEKEKQQDMVNAENNHSLMHIINRTIIIDEDSIRKDIQFVFTEDVERKNIDFVRNKLKDEFEDENVTISMADDAETGQVLQLIIYNDKQQELNRSLEKIFGEGNRVNYKYEKESKYKASSSFSEESDISAIIEQLDYTGDILYYVFGYNKEKIGEIEINGKSIQVDGDTYKGPGEIRIKSYYEGSCINYWPFEKRIEEISFLGFIILICIVFYKKNYVKYRREM